MASKSYRKFMATGLTAAVVASAVAPVASAATFTDVPANAWYKGAVEYVSGKGYMTGTSATTFAPTKDMTRAEAATLFANKLDLYKDGLQAGFTDVKSGAWYHNAVAAVKEGNIMGSTGDNMFSPDRLITRGEVAALIVRAYGFKGTGKETSFTDIDNSIFKNDIATLVELGIADGKSATKFAPTDLVSRAEMAAFIQKADKAATPVGAPKVTSVTAVADNKVVVNFNTAIKDVDHSNFSINGDLAIVDAKLSADKKSVELTTNLSFVDGVTYDVVATDIASLSGDEVSAELKGSFKFELAKYNAPTLSKSTFEKGENIKDYVVVKDESGKVISADKYTVTGIESDVAGAVDTTTGEIGASLTESTASLVKVTVTMYTGEVVEGVKTTINVTIPVLGATAVTASFDDTFENAVEAQNKAVKTYVVLGETDNLTVYTKDGKGNPEDDHLALNNSDYTVTVNKDSLHLVGSVAIDEATETIVVTGKAKGKANLTVTRKADGVKYPVSFDVVEPNNKYKDFSLSATSATLVKGDGVNGGETEESVDQKSIDIDWIDQDNNVYDVDFTGADTTPITNAKSSLTISGVATSGDKMVVSTQSDAVTLVETSTGIEVETKDGVSPQNALITVSYFDKNGKLVGQVKKININIAKEGTHAKYIIEQVGTLNAARTVTHTVTFNTYSVDANGVKRDDVTEQTDFAVKNGLATNVNHWIADSFDENEIGFDSAVQPTVANQLNYNGEFGITYLVDGASALGEATVQFVNTKVIQKSVGVNTKPVAIKLDATDATDGISIEDILFGKLNDSELRQDDELSKYFAVNNGQDGYKYNSSLISVKNTADATMISGSGVYGIELDENNKVQLKFEDTNSLNVVADIVNAKDLDTTSGLKIASGKTSATFTIVLDAVYVDGDTRWTDAPSTSAEKALNKDANLLAAPVTINVTLTK